MQVIPFSLRDHSEYALKDIETILALAKQHQVKAIVTTEKDAVKLKDWCNKKEELKELLVVAQLHLKIQMEDQIAWNAALSPTL